MYEGVEDQVGFKNMKLKKIPNKPQITVYNSSNHFVLVLCLFIVSATNLILVTPVGIYSLNKQTKQF